MTEETTSLKTAISLMRMALALLDKADETSAAAQLQHAISIATREPIMQLGDEVDPDLLDQHFRRSLPKE